MQVQIKMQIQTRTASSSKTTSKDNHVSKVSAVRVTLSKVIKGNRRSGTMLSQRTVHHFPTFLFFVSLPMEICSYQDRAITRQPVILCALVRSPGTVLYYTLVPHLRYPLSKTCSRHIFSRSYFTD